MTQTSRLSQVIILLVISAALLYLSFPNFLSLYGFWPFAWIFAVPLFLALDDQSLFKRILFGALFGLGFYALLVAWFIPYTRVGYVFFVLALSTQPVIFAALYPARHHRAILRLFYVCAAWVVSEYLRSLMFDGFAWGLGYSQTFNIRAIQAAHLLGAGGVSFVIILFNFCLYQVVRKQQPRLFGVVGLAAGILVFGYGSLSLLAAKAKGSPIEVWTIQPNIPPREKINRRKVYQNIEKQSDLTREIPAVENPDLIVWPETAIPSNFLRDHRMRSQVSALITEKKAHFLIGAALSEGGKNFNSAVLMNPESDVLGIYRKRRLVPFSENIPEGRFWEWLKKTLHIHSFTFKAGNEATVLEFHDRANRLQRFGVLICNEETLGSLWGEYIRQNVGFIIVMLNDGWFDLPTALMMHAQNGIMHAVEHRIPVVRAANSGWSVMIDSFGRIHPPDKDPLSSLQTRTVFAHTLWPNSQGSLYSKIGDTFCVLCILFVIMSLAGFIIEKRKT